METSNLPFTPQLWSDTMKQDGIPVLTMSIRRPAFPDEGKTARLERYFSEITRQWKTHWEADLFPKACQALNNAIQTGSSFLPWQAKLDYTVTLWQAPLLSLRLDVVQSDNTSRPTLICAGETWDCSTGYPRSLRSFFPAKNHRWRKELIDALRLQATERLASGESLLDTNCTQVMERSFDPDRFYLTGDGIAVFYPLYILGPYAEGIPVFIFPNTTV